MDINVKSNPRCSHILQRQNRILSLAEDRQVSSENMKKLKSKLNEIVNDINKDDKRSNPEILPKISTNTSRMVS